MSARTRRAPRRPRMRRWPLLLDAETRRNLDLRSRAHGVSRPDYVRALINGHRPGSVPGSPASLADTWWDTRSPSRRVSIWRNHAAAAETGVTSEGVGQLSIEDMLDTDDGGDA